jgi:hypothetical protein
MVQTFTGSGINCRTWHGILKPGRPWFSDSQVVVHAIHFLLAIAAGYGCALVAALFLRSPSRFRIAAAAFAPPLILLTPLLIPSEEVIARAFASLFCVDLALRLLDYLRYLRHAAARSEVWSDLLLFVLPFPFFLVVFAQYQRARSQGRPRLELGRIVGGALGIALALVLLLLAARTETLRSSFLLDHLAVAAIFVLTVESIAQLFCGVERLAGFATQPFVRLAFLSRTPAEFWYRYNNRIHAWLNANVFLAAGGRHAPVRAVCLTFLFSGLLHEVMFGIATSRLDGYQLTFFLLQIPGVLASPLLERLAQRPGWKGKSFARSVSIFWMVSTSIFFFHGVDRVFSIIYASTPWLP